MRTTHGFTLIELVVALVVLATATTGVLLIFANATAHSADPMIRAQARAIATAYMDEILLHRYCEDPPGCTVEISDGGNTEPGEDTRPEFDDVLDYDAIGGADPSDQTVADVGLDDYLVDVDVTVNGTIGADPARIVVQVKHRATGLANYRLYSERYPY